MKKKAFSAIDILVWLLVTIAIFLVGINVFNHVSIKSNQNDAKTLKEHIDSQITEIQDARQQAQEFEKEMLKNIE